MQQAKTIVQDYLKSLWSDRDLNAIEKYVDDHVTAASPMAQFHGKQKLHEVVEKWFSAFPDLSFEWKAFVTEGDKVAVHWIATGTQKGLFLGEKATHKKISWPGIAIYQVKEG